jgi:hypothetical protein
MAVLHYLTYLLLIVQFSINTLVFRFQRTTLGISRLLFGVGDAKVQSLLTPDWIGLLGWLNSALSIILIILILICFDWLLAIIFVFYLLIGAVIVDFITPLPSYKQCFNIIKNSLKNDIKNQIGEKDLLEQLLKQVIGIEYKYLN